MGLPSLSVNQLKLKSSHCLLLSPDTAHFLVHGGMWLAVPGLGYKATSLDIQRNKEDRELTFEGGRRWGQGLPKPGGGQVSI